MSDQDPKADLLKGRTLVAYDTETHLVQPGLLAPPLVIGSVANADRAEVLTTVEAREEFRSIISDPATVIGGANITYDFGVHAADDPSLVDLIFQTLEEGRAIDTHILEPLHDNARGRMFQDERGQPFNRYSLAMLETRYLGIDRSEEKKNGWRLKYALLDGVDPEAGTWDPEKATPLSEYPDDAIGYPRRDARGTYDVLMRQLGLAGFKEHDYGPDTKCKLCGAEIDFGNSECPKGQLAPRFNLQCVQEEMRAAWFLHLACLWGMRTDPVMVPEVVADIVRKHEESRRTYFDAGIVRVRSCTKKKDPKTGESVMEEGDDISAEWLAEARARLEAMREDVREGDEEPTWIEPRLKDIATCEKALAKGRPIRFAEDEGRLKDLVLAAYKGAPPLTAGGESGIQQVSTSRDTLAESGNELLEEYADVGPNEKLFSTYVAVLEQGTEKPINPEANTIVATQRTSYRRPNLQQLPRKGGIRECFVPRGYTYEPIQNDSAEETEQ